MNQCELNAIAENNITSYDNIRNKSSKFEAKGIFHSELLMVYTVAKQLGVERIIESGRARGQSTEIIARICDELKIGFDSIEFDRESPDVSIAEKRLAPLRDVCTLHYGDAFEIMPSILDKKKTLIIIDGPKGIWAQKLGLRMLKLKNVCAVMFHDSHRDAIDIRPRLEKYFGRYLITSDDYNFVAKYHRLDEECWTVTSDFMPGYAPYQRTGALMRSYAGTLSCVVNESIRKDLISAYEHEIEGAINIHESLFFKLASRLKLVGFLRKLYFVTI
ncbi:MAG: hypothetical protein KUG76_08075 [Gammaproteobacteria bacterium]|nr:hypothetical protein [Gammaproteobacteria bacterium]